SVRMIAPRERSAPGSDDGEGDVGSDARRDLGRRIGGAPAGARSGFTGCLSCARSRPGGQFIADRFLKPALKVVRVFQEPGQVPAWNQSQKRITILPERHCVAKVETVYAHCRLLRKHRSPLPLGAVGILGVTGFLFRPSKTGVGGGYCAET